MQRKTGDIANLERESDPHFFNFLTQTILKACTPVIWLANNTAETFDANNQLASKYSHENIL